MDANGGRRRFVGEKGREEAKFNFPILQIESTCTPTPSRVHTVTSTRTTKQAACSARSRSLTRSGRAVFPIARGIS